MSVGNELGRLQRQVENLQMEISTIKERLDDIKPFAQFAREQEEREEMEQQTEDDNKGD